MKATFSWNGRTATELDTYDLDSWPDWVKEATNKLFASGRDNLLCGFGNWECPLVRDSWRCGALPQPHKRKAYPYWFVVSKFPEINERHLFHGQQYSFTLTFFPKYQFWAATYQCARGAAWAEANEKELGAIEVQIAKVSKVSKRKIRTTLVDISNVFSLGDCHDH